MSCDMSSWARKTDITTISRDLFDDYNEIELCLTQKDEQNVHLAMTYSDGEERKVIGVDLAVASASDGLFRYGDINFNGNKVKSLLPAPVFGNGFTYDCENVAGENQYGGCGFAVVSKENASLKGVPSGFTSDFVLMPAKNNTNPAKTPIFSRFLPNSPSLVRQVRTKSPSTQIIKNSGVLVACKSCGAFLG